MTRTAPLMLAVLLLAGCGQPSAPTDANVAQADANGAEAANAMPPFAEVENAHPTAPEPAPIPAKFRGIWAEQKSVCSQLSHPSRLIISGRTLRFPAFVLEVDSVALPDDDSFAVKGHNKKTKAPAEAHYSVDPAGIVLTDEAGGGAERVKCG